jgi:hypothetical protein
MRSLARDLGVSIGNIIVHDMRRRQCTATELKEARENAAYSVYEAMWYAIDGAIVAAATAGDNGPNATQDSAVLAAISDIILARMK